LKAMGMSPFLFERNGNGQRKAGEWSVRLFPGKQDTLFLREIQKSSPKPLRILKKPFMLGKVENE